MTLIEPKNALMSEVLGGTFINHIKIPSILNPSIFFFGWHQT